MGKHKTKEVCQFQLQFEFPSAQPNGRTTWLCHPWGSTMCRTIL